MIQDTEEVNFIALGGKFAFNYNGKGIIFEKGILKDLEIMVNPIYPVNTLGIGMETHFRGMQTTDYSIKMDLAMNKLTQLNKPIKVTDLLSKKDLTIEEVFKFLNKQHLNGGNQ